MQKTIKKIKILKIFKVQRGEHMEEDNKNEKTRENSREQQKINIEAEVYNKNKKCDRIYTQTYKPVRNIKTFQEK